MQQRIALYLSGLYPWFYRLPNRLDIIMKIRQLDWKNFSDDMISLLKNSSDQEYYFSLLTTFHDLHTDQFEVLLNMLSIPEEVRINPTKDGNDATQTQWEVDKSRTISDINKPLVITEWKTDPRIIITAWSKLYPDKEMPFDIMECWAEDEAGGANVLKSQLQYISALGRYKTIIWLFDNDHEWNINFKGIKSTFEERSIDKLVRKHKEYPIYASLLPVPESRESYVDKTNIKKRFLEIEHYFSDSTLARLHLKWDPVVPQSDIFEIQWSKATFANNCHKLDAGQFKEFAILFDLILNLI